MSKFSYIIKTHIFLFLVLFSNLYSNDSTGEKYYQLENGLKIFLKENHKLPILHFALAVDVGSKDETDQTNGLVHLLEHLILMADSRSMTSDIMIQNMRQKGIIFNGHTGYDHMVFDMSLHPDQINSGLIFLKKKLFHIMI